VTRSDPGRISMIEPSRRRSVEASASDRAFTASTSAPATATASGREAVDEGAPPLPPCRPSPRVGPALRASRPGDRRSRSGLGDRRRGAARRTTVAASAWSPPTERPRARWWRERPR
jgi:hypothetical protein